jgi:hypothetical protein
MLFGVSDRCSGVDVRLRMRFWSRSCALSGNWIVRGVKDAVASWQGCGGGDEAGLNLARL